MLDINFNRMPFQEESKSKSEIKSSLGQPCYAVVFRRQILLLL